jgi:hypothetical protein
MIVLVDPLTRLSWHILLQALADAPKEQYSPESVIEGLAPWASIAGLPMKRLRETYMAAQAGTLDVADIRSIPRNDDSARKRLREIGVPMRKAWQGIRWEPEHRQGRRKTWAENIRALR